MELDLRGTDEATIRSYLALLGGVAGADGGVTGDGWAVTLTAGEHHWRQWTFPRVVLRFAGDPERVAAVAARLRIMAFRGGA